MEYPYCLPTFIDGIDDGEMAVRELQAESRSWRAEKYAADSNLLVLEHIDGEGRSACYNDAQIDTMLQVCSSRQTLDCTSLTDSRAGAPKKPSAVYGPPSDPRRNDRHSG